MSIEKEDLFMVIGELYIENYVQKNTIIKLTDDLKQLHEQNEQLKKLRSD